MSEFTKGPWRVGRFTPPNGCKTIGSNGLMVCQIAHSLNYPDQYKEAIGNANLIAAAPDMYEALRDILNNHDAGFYIDTIIRKVLEQARGEE
jgi:hypothetical protein